MRKSGLKHNLIKYGIADLLRFANKTPRVLFYHGVDTVEEKASLHISPEMFEQEMVFLSKHYEIVPIEEYYRRFQENKFTGKEIVVTFDDGYRNNLTIAAPILQSLDIPFTVFVSTRHIDNEQFFPTAIVRMITNKRELSSLTVDCLKFQTPLKDNQQRNQVCEAIVHTIKHSNMRLVNDICQQLKENVSVDEFMELCQIHKADAPMNWEEVKRLHADYHCTIGSHCADHFICNIYQSEEEILHQLKTSKATIEDKLQAPCYFLAYPNGIYNIGDVTEYAMQAASEVGYKLAFTTITDRLKPNSNPMLMPRLAARFEIDDFIVKLGLKPKFI